VDVDRQTAPTLEQLNGARLSRNRVCQWLLEPFLLRIIKGFFVRILRASVGGRLEYYTGEIVGAYYDGGDGVLVLLMVAMMVMVMVYICGDGDGDVW